MIRISRIAVFLCLVVAPAAQAQLVTNSPNLPPPAGQYITPALAHALYNTGFGSLVVDNVAHRDFFPSTLPPVNVGGITIDAFNSTVFGLGTAYDGPNGTGNVIGAFPFAAPGTPVMVNVQKSSGVNGFPTGTFNTEMLQLNLSSTSPFGPFMIRESPTLASTGMTQIADIGGGLYQIDSFFDVFTELSIDGGQSWLPSVGMPTHVVLVGIPEPTSMSLLGLAGVIGIAWRRRRR